ncbi:MAG: tRNA (adenosine(37)-N6)-threonylcarbamoyltransferase complex transferase subunit TsaD [Kiritimatiellae bacterium]|nr:tRNA (adenosine(37)-N6)-threonylcarbamoyltransferase complex transferase subunit TsaD [Kiritimatiellia bacterium]
MNILGIETSCDETAAAVVRDGREVLANVVYTQIPLHQPYGGVVPEIASRAHVEKISEVITTARDRFAAACPGERIDAVAVTYGPGLSPALIVGLNAAKGLAMSLGVPLIGINHIEAHLHTPFLRDAPAPADAPSPAAFAPALGLAISGGHTNWFDIPEYGVYHTIGQTLDDAAGEAFDKAAKLLGLGYPGGPKVDMIAKAYFAHAGGGQPSRKSLIPFPKGHPRPGVTALAGLPAELCVSFSGLKTALLRYVQQHPELLAPPTDAPTLAYGRNNEQTVTVAVAQVVASYQEAIVQAVADRTRTALRRGNYKSLLLGGGVSLNSRLRAVLEELCARERIPLLMALPKYCGDNGAMIAGLAYHRRNLMGEDALRLDVAPSLEIA